MDSPSDDESDLGILGGKEEEPDYNHKSSDVKYNLACEPDLVESLICAAEAQREAIKADIINEQKDESLSEFSTRGITIEVTVKRAVKFRDVHSVSDTFRVPACATTSHSLHVLPKGYNSVVLGFVQSAYAKVIKKRGTCIAKLVRRAKENAATIKKLKERQEQVSKADG